MPTGAANLMPRRTSYASVVSGAAATSPTYHQPARSGAFSNLYANEQAFGSNYSIGGNSRYDYRRYNMEAGGPEHGTGSWGRNTQLPASSSAFATLVNDPYEANGEHILRPSYLRDSKYMQKLEDAHKAKLVAKRDAPSPQSSQPGSLSTSNSSVNLPKLVPSHRGMTYDLIEKAPPLEDDSLAPLPSKWNSQDKHAGLEVLGDGYEVKYVGSKSASDRDHEASSVRADHAMPPQCGIYYYEIEILSRKREEYDLEVSAHLDPSNVYSRSSIGIGFSEKDVPLSRPPGWEPKSWAYHGDDGHSFCCQSAGKLYGPPFTTGDIIGCGVNFNTGRAFFTKNGVNLGTAFREIKDKGKLFPSVGMKRSGEHIRVNFGQRPFAFNIDDMMMLEKMRIRGQIEATSTEKLAPPLDETNLIQALVLQFLSHDGYVESAKAFAEEVHAEKQALILDPAKKEKEFDFGKEDADAINRQRIRTAIIEGDVDKALKYTETYYPSVLKDNEHIYFSLRIRKFIEMIRHGAELRAKTESAKNSNGHNGDWYDDVLNHDMELDEQPPSNNFDRMDTDSAADTSQFEGDTKLIAETLVYGQLLQAEFESDPRREVKRALKEAFALIAYDDPWSAREVSHLLKKDARMAVAEELNSAILVSQGKSSVAALERLIQQAHVLTEDLREDGGPGCFVNVDEYMRPQSPPRHF